MLYIYISAAAIAAELTAFTVASRPANPYLNAAIVAIFVQILLNSAPDSLTYILT